jgi:hypothetical protein
MQSQNTTNLYIELYGMLKGTTGKKRRVLAVFSVLKDTVNDLTGYLDSLNISSTYILYINETFVKSALEQHPDCQVAEGDVFKVIPIVSRGLGDV